MGSCGDCVEFGHRFDLHLSAMQLPFVVGFQQHGADEADDAHLVAEDADNDERLTGLSSDL
jgi:hypothetical protein